MLVLSPLGGAAAQFLDNNGRPLSGGKLYTYEGGTTTPAVTYLTNTGSVAHSNPIVLDAAGRVPGGSGEIWIETDTLYKFNLRDSNDVTLMTWDNISVIVGADNYAPAESDPAGVIVPYAGTVAPSGWLLCDGSAVNRTTYNRLFTAINTTFGEGNGTTTFNLPDMRGRAVIGVGQGTSLTDRVLGATGGAETHTLTEAEMPVHDHTSTGLAYSTTQYVSSIQAGSGVTWVDNLAPLVQGSTQIDLSSTGGGEAHNNMQPFVALNYIIRI